MKKYIDANALYSKLFTCDDGSFVPDFDVDGFPNTIPVRDLKRLIHAFPAADVVERSLDSTSTDVRIVVIDDDERMTQERIDDIFGRLSVPTSFLRVRGDIDVESETQSLVEDTSVRYVVLMNAELSNRDRDENDRLVKSVLSVLLPQPNVYLVLYTDTDPDACAWLHRAILGEQGLGATNAKLYRDPVDLYFWTPPYNYEYFLRLPFRVSLHDRYANNWINLGVTEEG